MIRSNTRCLFFGQLLILWVRYLTLTPERRSVVCWRSMWIGTRQLASERRVMFVSEPGIWVKAGRSGAERGGTGERRMRLWTRPFVSALAGTWELLKHFLETYWDCPPTASREEATVTERLRGMVATAAQHITRTYSTVWSCNH
ncbi:hypothetical protein B0T09DRAFT_118729 [Sordaria sp. MPI-SDFR-AT-0083]|nr:hypothetical protein B0T09DRAFT_118729 [Sordaria sp. MPI-SDFR-AT-0083]